MLGFQTSCESFVENKLERSLQRDPCPSGWDAHLYQEGDDIDLDNHMTNCSMVITRDCYLNNSNTVEDKPSDVTIQ